MRATPRIDRETYGELPRPLMASKFLFAVAVATLMAACLMKHGGMVSNERSGEDFYHFWIIPRIANIDPNLDWYDRSQHSQILAVAESITSDLPSDRLKIWQQACQAHYDTGLHPTGTPWFYAALGAFQICDVEIDYQIFQTISTLVFLAGCFGLALLKRTSFYWSAATVAVFFLLHRGIESDIGVCNVNRLQTGLSCIFLICMFSCPHRYLAWTFVIGSVAMGAFIAFKPNVMFVPVYLVIAFFLDGEYRKASTHTALVLVGGSIAWYLGWAHKHDPSIWISWKEYTETMWTKPFSIQDGNYAALLLTHLEGAELKQLSTLLTMFLIGASFVAIWRTRTVSSGKDRYLRIGLLGLIPLLISAPVTWGHYLTLSIPVGILLIQDLMFAPSTMALRVLTSVGVVLTAIVPAAWIPNVEPHFLLVSIQFGIVSLYVAGLYSLGQTAAESTRTHDDMRTIHGCRV